MMEEQEHPRKKRRKSYRLTADPELSADTTKKIYAFFDEAGLNRWGRSHPSDRLHVTFSCRFSGNGSAAGAARGRASLGLPMSTPRRVPAYLDVPCIQPGAQTA